VIIVRRRVRIAKRGAAFRFRPPVNFVEGPGTLSRASRLPSERAGGFKGSATSHTPPADPVAWWSLPLHSSGDFL